MYSLNNKSFKIALQISEIDGTIFDTFQNVAVIVDFRSTASCAVNHRHLETECM